jgi:hypothetical protein
MQNVFISSSIVTSGSLVKGGTGFGVVEQNYGPTTANTGFYNTIAPPANGYVFYQTKTQNGPIIKVANTDAELINYVRLASGTTYSISGALQWAATQNNIAVANFDYPNIITSGSILYLDAGFVCSYPTTASTWYDISGNASNGTLTNGPTFSSSNSGSIVFDGVDDFAQCAGSFTLTSATFITWIKRNGNQGQYDGILFSRGTNTTGMNFFSSNQLGYHWNDAAATYNWASGLTIPNLTWCMIAISVTSTSATAYLCQTSGITTSTNITSHASSVLNDIKIAQDDAGGRFFNGNIAISQLYNRALSTNEITQNFNALKGRFGV